MRKIDILFLLPALIVLIILIGLPLMNVGYQSFTNAKLHGKSERFVGIDNYVRLIHDSRFWNSVKVTFILAAGSLAIQMAAGLGLALLLQQRYWFTKLSRALFIIPMTISPVVVGIIWKMLFSSVLPGINFYLSLIGIEGPVWFGRGGSAQVAVIIAHAWYWMPHVLLMLLAGLESLPREPIAAAYVDGANSWQIFIYITLPMLKPVLIFTAIYRAVQALKIFGLIYIMTGGGPGVATEPMNYHIWQVGFSSYRVGYASTIAVIMMLIIFITVAIVYWYGRKTKAIR
jgi:multiple sugar transport system permease protein